jgi:hypothetical protein
MDVAQVPDFRPVNVTADNAGHPHLSPILNHGLLIILDVFHRRLGFEFDERCKRPIAEPQEPPDPVDPGIEIKDSVIERRPDLIEQPIELRQPIKLMPVDDKVFLAVRRGMHGPLHQPHIAKGDAEKLLKKLVVVSDDECDLRLFAIFSKKLLHEQVVLIRPVPLATQLPAINEVTYDVEKIALCVLQEFQQGAHLRMPRAQVNVGNPNGPVMSFLVHSLAPSVNNL